MEANYAGILCDNTIKTGKSVCLTATGTSMWPTITEGMRAIIEPLPSGLPKKGSLLLIRRANRLMVHRYWGVTYKEGSPLVITKGDTNLAFDHPAAASMVLGKVSLLINSVGDCRDPNRGWLRLIGLAICSSCKAARIWARLCQLLLRFGAR